MKKILIFGASGMLGVALTQWFACRPDIRVTGTVRCAATLQRLKQTTQGVVWELLSAELIMPENLAKLCEGYDLVINAIGKIKQRMLSGSLASQESALRANALFPLMLGQAAEAAHVRLVQIATDCVFSGAGGPYDENAPHDPQDVYGKTKSLGEVVTDSSICLRCSIVGHELDQPVSLLGWFLSQPEGARISGYTNHLWNGVTTHHFSKICEGLLNQPRTFSHPVHVVPANAVSKYELLTLFKDAFARPDIEIIPIEASQPIDRRLTTLYPEENAALWRAAGYETPPSIETMVQELATHGKQK